MPQKAESLIYSSRNDEVNLIRLPKELSKDAIKEFETMIPQWSEGNTKLHILDFREVSMVKDEALRAIIVFKKTVRGHGGMIVSINLSDIVRKRIELKGLLEAIQEVDSLPKAYEMANLSFKLPKLDVNLVNSFLMATKETLGMQCDTEVQLGSPFTKSEAFKPKIGIMGVLSIDSDYFRGSASICFPDKVFLGLYNKMMEESHDQINDEVQDAAAEILNIIFGMAKAQLNNAHNYGIKKAIPAVIRGQNLSMSQISDGPSVILPFACEFGDFHLDIKIEMF